MYSFHTPGTENNPCEQIKTLLYLGKQLHTIRLNIEERASRMTAMRRRDAIAYKPLQTTYMHDLDLALRTLLRERDALIKIYLAHPAWSQMRIPWLEPRVNGLKAYKFKVVAVQQSYRNKLRVCKPL